MIYSLVIELTILSSLLHFHWIWNKRSSNRNLIYLCFHLHHVCVVISSCCVVVGRRNTSCVSVWGGWSLSTWLSITWLSLSWGTWRSLIFGSRHWLSLSWVRGILRSIRRTCGIQLIWSVSWTICAWVWSS